MPILNQIEIISYLFGNIIFLFVLSFTDYVYSDEAKEIIGRVIIIILGFYICFMLSFIAWFGAMLLKNKIGKCQGISKNSKTK